MKQITPDGENKFMRNVGYMIASDITSEKMNYKLQVLLLHKL